MEGIFSDLGFWLSDIGLWAYLLAPLLMAAVSILPLPAEAPAMLNGALFGPLAGTGVTWLGAMLGAWISFELARRWGRPTARRWVTPKALDRIDALVQDAGWWELIVARLVPVVAFTALNWGLGLCGVPRRRFLWTTAVGIVPGAVLFTASGVGLAAFYRRRPEAALVVGFLILLALARGVQVRRARARG